MAGRTFLSLLVSILGGAILFIAGIVPPALAKDAHAPQEVRVIVFNGSGASGAAQDQRDQLLELGFLARLSEHRGLSLRKASTVACRRGFKADAKSFAAIIPRARVAKWSATDVSDEPEMDCAVILGSNSVGDSVATVSVAVFNASGQADADVAVAADLRSDYYDVPFNGSGQVPQIGTTVACRSGLENQTEKLAERLSGTVAPFPGPTTWDYSDCIVVVGRDVPGN